MAACRPRHHRHRDSDGVHRCGPRGARIVRDSARRRWQTRLHRHLGRSRLRSHGQGHGYRHGAPIHRGQYAAQAGCEGAAVPEVLRERPHRRPDRRVSAEWVDTPDSVALRAAVDPDAHPAGHPVRVHALLPCDSVWPAEPAARQPTSSRRTWATRLPGGKTIRW